MLKHDTLRTHREALFWGLHTLGWAAYAAVQTAGALLWERPEGYMEVAGAAAVSGFLLSAPLRLLYRWLWTRSPWAIVAGGLAASCAVALLWRLAIGWSYGVFMPERDAHLTLPGLLVSAANSAFIPLCWTGLYFGIKYYESLQRERERRLSAVALAQEAQLKMLRYQLNPHFLFNTLNTISTLILDRQNDLANQAVMRLSEFLRRTLDQDPVGRVTLRQEVEAINLYLATERLRFSDRLRFETDVDERALDALVPSLLLQPLVENAVKHAVAPREQGGAIRVEARLDDGWLVLAVSDDGPGLGTATLAGHGRGGGLRNTRERLEVLYGVRHRLELLDAGPGLRVEGALPHERVPA